jgi:hypothetical protein
MLNICPACFDWLGRNRMNTVLNELLRPILTHAMNETLKEWQAHMARERLAAGLK